MNAPDHTTFAQAQSPRLALAVPFSELVARHVRDLPIRRHDTPADGAALAVSGVALASPAASAPTNLGGYAVAHAAGPLSSLTARERTRMIDALASVFDQRQRQIDYGHTLDRDLARGEPGEKRLLALAIDALNAAREDVTLHPGGSDWRSIAIRHAAASAALSVAFIELMIERQAQEALEPEPAPAEQENLGL